MGGGIWAMHFVAMLAFSVSGMDISYNFELTLVSLVVAILATGISFLVMSRGGRSRFVLAASGLFMGLGIVAMHYIGMAAMAMAAKTRYDPRWIVVAFVIAISASTVALWLALQTSGVLSRAVAALAMGLAISGMHYAAMRGLTFVADPSMAYMPASAALGQATLALAVASSTFLILFLAVVAAMFDRRFARLAEREASLLRQSEERFRALYTKTPLPLFSLDETGCLQHVSDAWLGLLGYTREEVIGRPLVNFMDEASAGRIRETDWSALLREGALDGIEYRVVTQLGDMRDVIASARVERDEGGNFLRALGGLTDVTAMRRAEDALRQAQKMEAVGQLTGGVAHDFNNLLTIIRSSVDLLRRPNLSVDRQIRYLDAVADTVDRASKVTGQLLAFARRQALKPEMFEVRRRVCDMAEMLDAVTGSRIRVVTDLPEERLFIRADISQFETAIINMAVNARDAMEGEGTLTLRVRRNGGSTSSPDLDEAFVSLSVIDTGSGIPEAHLPRIFEPFYTTKPIGRGTGLGLSQVFGFTKQSGGDLSIDTVLGQGTTFTLHLPEVRGPTLERTDEPERPEGDLLGHGERILVVEDNAEVGRFATQLLFDLGYRADLAASAEDALRKLADAREVYDMVLSDVVMPGMSGLDMARSIRISQPSLPIVLTSGYSDALARGEKHDFPLLNKPYSADQLARILRQSARNHERSEKVVAMATPLESSKPAA